MSNAPPNMPPLDQQENEQTPATVWSRLSDGIGYLGGRIASLFREDREIAALLTPEFKENFRREFNRMMEERRSGVAASVSFSEHVRVRGYETEYRIFDALIKDSGIDRLPAQKASVARLILMRHCCLCGTNEL
ncbi:hypothetical protein A3D88_03620 [Candidatus Peribacteria bacterium RIFCSPHIGHO2_02_FULL_52_16]|nr:MAG: hypothetical protein A2706_04435 [Candidatus Peribacteria bacterium RIFCSPHIGHO2_01_FULL_51_35]OGJ61772.1 MAG: hypothetical protein A3D88_03620 [Candidatus Peribacteria bacterium RIFCSPHIGHO2_02_FULL_52_16]